LYRDYKINHSPMPSVLADALPSYRDAFAELGVTSFELPKLEADDVIGTLAVKIAGGGGQAVILSTDKIFLQLLSEQIVVRDHFKPADLDRAYVATRFGATPETFVDFLSLSGDSTNSITGVPGIGPKTAARLIDEFGSLEEILAAAAPGGEHGSLTQKLCDKLEDHADDARLAQSLVRLQTNLDLGLNLDAERPQVLGDQRGGFELAVAELRILVNLVAVLDDARREPLDRGGNAIVGLWPRGERRAGGEQRESRDRGQRDDWRGRAEKHQVHSNLPFCR